MEPSHSSPILPSDSAATPAPRRFHVASFGCRASQSEGASIEAELAAAGRAGVDSPYDADVIVINSCTVTAEADRDVDRLIRRLNRRNPNAAIIVTGCYAQRSPSELAEHPQVRYVVGNSHKSLVSGLAADCMDDPIGQGRSEVFCSGVFELVPLSHQGSAGRTRATLKVQDGCDAHCAFCIIPEVRGRSRSLDAASVVGQVRDLVDRDYREVVFSGIHLGSWGRDLAAPGGLVDLVRQVLEEVPDLECLRLSSIEPREVSGELVRLISSDVRIAPHLHVPMQSGSARVLRSMRRPYGPVEYSDRVRDIRNAMPAAAIGADVMVGFPGETDADFMETVRVIEALPLTYLHVFPYSPRPGTPAAGLGDSVPPHVAAFRRRTLVNLGAEKNARFRRQFVGRRLRVLSLESGRGLSSNFIGVHLSPDLEVNRWHDVEIRGEIGAELDSCPGRGAGRALQDSRMTMAAETV